jgi:5'-nucleotidase
MRFIATPLPFVPLTLSLLLGACSLAPLQAPAPPAPTAPVPLRLIAFNDLHGNLEPGTLSLTLPDPAQPGKTLRVPVGGAPALAGLVQTLRQGAANSVVVSSGDAIGAAPLVSTLFRHESTIETLNLLGLDVATVGNHEFDAGRAELLRVLGGGCAPNEATSAIRSCALHAYTGAQFKVVTSNIQTSDGQALFAPSWVREFGGVKVGFIGAVTRGTPSIVVPSGIVGLGFKDEAEAINRAAAALKAQGVNALVATLHEGGEIGAVGQPADWNDTSCPFFRGYILNIARHITPDVGVLLTGHTHQGYRCVVDGRPVVQATSYGRGVSVVDVMLDPATGRILADRTTSRNLPVLNDRTPEALRETLAAAQPAPYGQVLRNTRPLPAVAQLVAGYAALAAETAGRQVGGITGNFDRRGRTDSSAGRLIADAQLAATRAPDRGGAQIALMNPGGVRTDLACAKGAPPCDISHGEAFAMQPFGNSLVVVTLSGAELKALLESQQPAGRSSATLMSPSDGLRYRWVASAPFGQRVQGLQLSGQPIRAEQDYRVTVNSFMAEGGDGFDLLKRGRNRLGGVLDLEALVAFLATRPTPVTAPRVDWVD